MRNSILVLVIAVSVLAPFNISTQQTQTFIPVVSISSISIAHAGPWDFRDWFSSLGSGIKLAATDPWGSIKAGIAISMLSVSGWVLGASGLFFDIVINQTVENMATLVDSIAGIDIAWRVLRDMVNMIFIFALLYIAIATILRIEEYGAKRLLARIIIVALLINFSLFFTKVAIDASNVLSAEFVNGIKQLNLDKPITIGHC